MSRWAVRHPVTALVAWVVLLVAIGFGASRADGVFNDSFALPGVQSTTAQDLLTKYAGKPSDTTSVRIVWSPTSGSVTDATTKQAIEPALKALAALDFVDCVAGPYGVSYGADCPKATPVDLRKTVVHAARKQIAKTAGIPEDRLGEAMDLLDRLEPLEDADPAKLAQIARALPAISRLAAAPKPVLAALASVTPEELEPIEGLTTADITAALDAVGGMAAFADLPKSLLTALASADPDGLTALIDPLIKAVGGSPEDQAKVDAVTKALPTLAALAKTSGPTLDALAKLTPHDLSFLVGITKQDVREVTEAFGDLAKFAQLPESTLHELATANPSHLAALASAVPSDVTKASKAMAEAKAKTHELAQAATATQKATAPVSPDGKVAYATVTIDGTAPTAEQTTSVRDLIEAANSSTLTVGASGAALEGAGTGRDASEGIGLLVAIIILLLAFGSLVAAGLPIVVALTGLVAGQLLVTIAAHFMDVATFAPTLAAMIGLGVGIDYALFVMNRFHQGVASGVEPKQAAIIAVGTAGKAVAFAGTTVMIALLGMFVLGIGFFDGLAVAAASAVLMVMLAALLMLPALLSLLGSKSVALRLPWRRQLKPFDPERSRWSRYGRLLQRAPIVPALLAFALIGLLAAPSLSMRMGFPDDSSEAQGSPLRVGFDLLAAGFGAGVNGPFYVAVQTPKAHDYEALRTVVHELESTPGVAGTIPSIGMLPLLREDGTTFGPASAPKDDRTITSVIVQPDSAPSAQETTALLDRIRATTAPAIESASGARIYVGGTQAVAEDFTAVLSKALPVFLLLVIGLGFVALMLLFHSLVIPLTAAITSLLSFAASLGITVAVFQHGVADSLLGVTGTGPILPFLPIMVFAILFGLSMDYQVFLVTRMREEWDSTHDNADAVRRGLAGSGRVVVVAATIMTSVFASFIPTPIDAIKVFGVALASAVLVDAFVVRLVLVPSLMTLFGRANWWLPRWLDRLLPTIHLD